MFILHVPREWAQNSDEPVLLARDVETAYSLFHQEYHSRIYRYVYVLVDW